MLIVISMKYCIKFSIFCVFARFFGVAQMANRVFGRRLCHSLRKCASCR